MPKITVSQKEYEEFLEWKKSKEKKVNAKTKNNVQTKTNVQMGNKKQNSSVKKSEIKVKYEVTEPVKKETYLESMVRKRDTYNAQVKEAKEKAKNIKYVISRKRLDVHYDQAKADFSKYKPATQKRYWSAWHKFQEDQKTPQEKASPSYRIVVGYKVKVGGEYMRDIDDSIITYHYSGLRNKKRLNKAELAELGEEIQTTTNAKVVEVKAEMAYDNWTGKKV